MRFFVIFAAMFLLLILQAGILGNLGLGQIGNLILIFAVVSMLLANFEESFFVVLVGGVMLDLVSASRAGSMVIAFLAVFGVINLVLDKLLPRDPNRVVLLASVGLGTVVFTVTFILVNRLLNLLNLDTLVDWQHLLGNKLLLDLLVNIILAYPVYLLYLGIQKIQQHGIVR